MPKVVDHDARRETLAATAARVIAERGVENTRLRDVARQAGFSTSIVGHYFNNKDALILSALDYVDRQVASRFAKLRNRSIKQALETILPLDDERRMEWRVRINFWGRATVQPELARSLAESLAYSQQTMAHILGEQIEQGTIRRDIDIDSTAESLVNASMSLSVRVLFQPDVYSKGVVSERIERLLALI